MPRNKFRVLEIGTQGSIFTSRFNDLVLITMIIGVYAISALNDLGK